MKPLRSIPGGSLWYLIKTSIYCRSRHAYTGRLLSRHSVHHVG